MIETTNNIIFYAGYFFLFTVFLVGGLVLLYAITKPVLQYKQFYIRIFNHLVTKSFKEISDEKFEEWISRMRTNYRKENKSSK